MKILVCDDEEKLRVIIGDFLTNEGYEVVEASNGLEALELVKEDKHIDLVILDVMMPKMDGWMACQKIKEISNVPVVILTAKSMEYDEVFSLNIGADEYISKPFKPLVLVARVNALLRRNNEHATTYKIDDSFVIKNESHEVIINNNQIELTPKEYEILLYLYENKGILFTREQLLDAIWGLDAYVTERTVDTCITRLRNKLEDRKECIKTIRGFGYKFDVNFKV